MKIDIDAYMGSRPRLAEYLLGKSQASQALDCRLEHGTLDAWREPKYIRNAPGGTVSTFQHGCCWFDYDSCVDHALGPVSCPRVYLTGAAEYPQVATIDADTCAISLTRLGLPCSLKAPSVLASDPTSDKADKADKDQEGRTYAYLYENRYGERSALSMASDAILVYENDTVVVSGWDTPAVEWGITKVLIYRAVSSVGSGQSAVSADNTADTTWMLVTELPIDATSYTDTVRNETLSEALETGDLVDPPPADLRGIVAIEAMNCLAGFTGNRLYFSENNKYHSWTIYLELDDNIRGIVESNQLIYVATDGHPYVVEATADCKGAECRRVTRLAAPLPMVPMGNRHMAAIPSGAVYPSHDGLVALSGNSVPVIITHPLYAPEDWQQLRPATVLPEIHAGKLFVFARGGSFVMKLNDTTEPGWDMDSHSSLSDIDVVDVFTTRQGDMYLLKDDGKVVQWNRGATLRPYVWRSPLWALPQPVAFAAQRLRVTNGEVQAIITADKHIVYDESVARTQIDTLPMWAFGTDWQLTLRGTATVGPFALATAMEDL